MQNEQAKVNSLVKYGIILSILWLAGIGSLASLIMGLKARKIVNASNGEVVGGFGIWWCIIVGGLGVAFWLPIILVGIFNKIGG